MELEYEPLSQELPVNPSFTPHKGDVIYIEDSPKVILELNNSTGSVIYYDIDKSAIRSAMISQNPQKIFDKQTPEKHHMTVYYQRFTLSTEPETSYCVFIQLLVAPKISADNYNVIVQKNYTNSTIPDGTHLLNETYSEIELDDFFTTDIYETIEKLSKNNPLHEDFVDILQTNSYHNINYLEGENDFPVGEEKELLLISDQQNNNEYIYSPGSESFKDTFDRDDEFNNGGGKILKDE